MRIKIIRQNNTYLSDRRMKEIVNNLFSLIFFMSSSLCFKYFTEYTLSISSRISAKYIPNEFQKRKE